MNVDRAAEFYGFDDGERAEYVALQRRLASDPVLLKKFVRAQRRFMRAARMSPTIKSK